MNAPMFTSGSLGHNSRAVQVPPDTATKHRYHSSPWSHSRQFTCPHRPLKGPCCVSTEGQKASLPLTTAISTTAPRCTWHLQNVRIVRVTREVRGTTSPTLLRAHKASAKERSPASIVFDVLDLCWMSKWPKEATGLGRTRPHVSPVRLDPPWLRYS